MSVAAGTRLGPYEILAPLGAGGMGEVWKARDTRLGRTVAIKISGEQFTDRVSREARLVASLNHPHICQLYDVGPNFIVMEYVDGHILSGPLPLREALEYGAQICDALDTAHRAGVVHRDLKPANILVTKSGIKLLDFGLAKQHRAPAPGADTETFELTKENSILGTLHFMSPEQLEGKDADTRSDIFAFGSVLYEMITGKPAFEGASQASLIAAIMDHDPEPLSQLEPSVPKPLDRVIAKCLAKSPDRRWQSASDLKDELEWIAATAGETSGAVPRTRTWREVTAWILAGALLCVSLALFLYTRRAPASAMSVRFPVYPPSNGVFSGPGTVPTPQFDISPDGGSLVFVAAEGTAKPMLWLRTVDDISVRTLPGTEDAQDPFWSPDGRWVAFLAEGRLRKVPVSGGSVEDISNQGLLDARGGTWGSNGVILFSSNNILYSVPAAGGTVTPLTRIDTARREGFHRWPRFLPDGRHFLYSVRGAAAQPGIYAGSLDGKTKKFLVRSDSNAFYASPGYLLYLDQDMLLAQPFDAGSLELKGSPFPVADRVGRSSFGDGAVAVSQTGVLAYAGPILRTGHLTWFDRMGSEIGIAGAEGDYTDFRLSPDGTRLAASLVDARAGWPDIWLTDLTRGSTFRYTFGPFLAASPLWSPDGTRLVFRRTPRGVTEFFEKSAAGAGNEQAVLTQDQERAAHVNSVTLVPTDWSPDGRNIIFAVPAIGSGFELWRLPMDGTSTPIRFLQSTADLMHANFSPDGKLIAYSSNESGRFEVYVQTFPLTDRKWQVSTSGGYEPRWRADGREIYYLSEGRKLMAAEVKPGSSFGVPKVLFQTRVPAGVNGLRTNYVPDRDGRRFLVNTQSSDAPPEAITVTVNWLTGHGTTTNGPAAR